MTIPERTKSSIQGLRNFVAYINRFEPTHKMTILEVGSWTGCSMEIFAQYFKKVICVDPWKSTEGINTHYKMEEVEKIFNERMSKYSNVIKCIMTFEDLYPIKNIDIIYIDGIHTYEAVKHDNKLALELKPRYIAGHDYWQSKFPGVIKAVNEVLGKPDKIFSDSSWFKKLC